jgi:hypothetical protein
VLALRRRVILVRRAVKQAVLDENKDLWHSSVAWNSFFPFNRLQSRRTKKEEALKSRIAFLFEIVVSRIAKTGSCECWTKDF